MSDNPAVSGNTNPRSSNKSLQPRQEVTKTGSPQRATKDEKQLSIKGFTPPLRTSDRKTSDSPTKALPGSSKEGKKSETGKILPKSETASSTVDTVRTKESSVNKDESVRKSSKTGDNDSSSPRKTSLDRQGVKRNSDRTGDSSKTHIRPDKGATIARGGNSIRRPVESIKVNNYSSPLMKTSPDRQEVRKNSDQTGQSSEGGASGGRRRSPAMLTVPIIPGKDKSDKSFQDQLGNDLSASGSSSNLRTNDFRGSRSLSRRPRDSFLFADELNTKEIRVENSNKKTSSTANEESQIITRVDQENETRNTNDSADLPKLTTSFASGEVEGDQIQLDLEDLEVRHTKGIMMKPPRDSIRLNRMDLEAFRKKLKDEEVSPPKQRKPKRNSPYDQYDFKDILQNDAERPSRIMSTTSNVRNTSGGHKGAHEVALPYHSNTRISERRVRGRFFFLNCYACVIKYRLCCTPSVHCFRVKMIYTLQ